MYNLADVKAVFFDLDDTIYDQLKPFQLAVVQCKVPLATDKVTELFKRVRYYSDVLWKVYTKGEIDLELVRVERVRCAFKDFGISLSSVQAKEIQDCYENEQKRIHAFPGVLSMIQDLMVSKPVVGIITNGPVNHQMNKIKALKIDQIIPLDNLFISDGIGITKPDKRVFEYVQKRINVDPDKCCYIGDTWENDIVPSIEAGWRCIWFNHRNREPESNHIPNETIKTYDNFILK